MNPFLTQMEMNKIFFKFVTDFFRSIFLVGFRKYDRVIYLSGREVSLLPILFPFLVFRLIADNR